MNRMNEKGFTLTELLIVIAIIGIIGTFVGSNIIGNFNKAKVDSTKIQMRNIGNALKDYYRDCGRFPLTNQGLEALITPQSDCKNYNPSGYLGENLKKVPEDGFGGPFMYFSDNGVKYEIRSLGQDKQEGGDGLAKDISSNDLD